jgi:hypothetical protein
MTRRRNGEPTREAVSGELQPTADCIGIERFDEALSEREREHLSGCARCQAELALWHEFVNSSPRPEDQDAVTWVSTQLRRRRAQAATALNLRSRPMVRRGTLIAAAASILVAVALGYVVWDPEPALNGSHPAAPTFRRAQLDVVGPQGDIAMPPRELAWVALDGAVRYDVRVFEIDGTTLWEGSTSVVRVGFPPDIMNRFVPGKPVHWEVTARDGTGAELASSGTRRFRVSISPSRRQ